jgi:hypothetical protein
MMLDYVIEFLGDFVINGLGYMILRYGFKKKDINFNSKEVSYTGWAAFVIIVSLFIGLIYFFF